MQQDSENNLTSPCYLKKNWLLRQFFMKWLSDIYLDAHTIAGGNAQCGRNQKLVKIHNPSTGANIKATQIAQNKMIRMVENVSLKEHFKSVDMLKKNGLLSVNQLVAQIKLTEAWKSINIEDYPVKLENNQTMRQTC